MDPTTIAIAMWTVATAYQTYGYWSRKKATQEAEKALRKEQAIAQEQAMIRTAARAEYWKERESLRQRKLEQEKQQRKLEQEKQEYWKKRNLREAENLMNNTEHIEMKYQPNPPELEEEILKIISVKNSSSLH